MSSTYRVLRWFSDSEEEDCEGRGQQLPNEQDQTEDHETRVSHRRAQVRLKHNKSWVSPDSVLF